MRFSLSSSHALLEMKCDMQVSYEMVSKGGFPLSRNFYVRTDVNFNWLYVRKLK